MSYSSTEKVTERKSLLAAYRAANPEEKARIIAECKTREEQRKQMRIDEQKQRFIEKSKKESASLEETLNAAKTVLEVIKSFDGKVLNNRLVNAINEKFDNQIVRVSLVIAYNYDSKQNEGKLKIYLPKVNCGEPRMVVRIIMSNPPYENRVVWNKTEEIFNNETAPNIEKEISDLKDAMNNYDNYYAKAMEVQRAIDEYSQINFNVLNYFRAEKLFNGTYYL